MKPYRFQVRSTAIYPRYTVFRVYHPKSAVNKNGGLSASFRKSQMCEADVGADERGSFQVLCHLEE